jgi:hypothetical protein
MKLLVLFGLLTKLLAVNVLTFYNGNYTVRPQDYNNKSTVTVQLWGDNAVRYGLFNTYGSSGGFIEAVVETNGNTTFNVQTGTPTLTRTSYYLLFDGLPSSVFTNKFYLRAGGGKWREVVCESFYKSCFVPFGGINEVIILDKVINISTNFNGTGKLALNNGMVRFYY